MFQLIVKMSDEDKQKLDYLCSVYSENRSSLIRSFINEQYDSFQGNPELKNLLKQMSDIGKSVEKITGKSMPEFPMPDFLTEGQK